MISISNLQKSYGRLNVLKGMDLQIGDGAITAILGPNGAGKTTLIKAILGLVKPDSGSIVVNETRLNGNSDYRRDLGYMPQTARYPENLTVQEIIDMVKDIRGYSLQTDEELIQSFRLESELGKKFKTLSGGNRQKVSAVVAFLFNPKIIFLDEPTAGLDPISSSKLKDKIQAEKERGKTIILTSHILSEVQELADRVVYILEGRIAFDTPMQNLLDHTGEATLERAVARMIEQGEMSVTGSQAQISGQSRPAPNIQNQNTHQFKSISMISNKDNAMLAAGPRDTCNIREFATIRNTDETGVTAGTRNTDETGVATVVPDQGRYSETAKSTTNRMNGKSNGVHNTVSENLEATS